MILSKDFLLKIHDSCYINRWNEFLRPIDIIELDNQAFKWILAYILAKIEENQGVKIDWIKLVKYLIFDFLDRIILTDIKPDILDKLKKEYSEKLNDYILNICKNVLDFSFLKEFEEFLKLKVDFEYFSKIDKNDEFLIKIIFSSSKLASKWEYEKFIEPFNEIKIKNEKLNLNFEDNEIKEKYGLKSVGIILDKDKENYKKFLDICFSLRYQIRWTGKHRIPKTSVLGHELIVSITTFAFFYENNFLNGKNEKIIYNNFFTALFHDLPEALTRDIISPIKYSSLEISEIIKDIEIEKMKKIYSLLPGFGKDIELFTKDEFENKTDEAGCITRHGKIIKVFDSLSAMIEAYISVKDNGINNADFIKCCNRRSIEALIDDLNEFSKICKVNRKYDFLEEFVLS